MNSNVWGWEGLRFYSHSVTEWAANHQTAVGLGFCPSNEGIRIND